MNDETFVYKPGNLCKAHPIPADTTPMTMLCPVELSWNIMGPPESPWQASCPPKKYQN